MRVIHTADWHIGHELFGYSRSYEHQCFLDWLLGQCRELEPDALLIAGDVFHHSNPSNEALEQFARFADRLRTACPATSIVAIAGNHDSPARFEAMVPLLRDGVRLVGGIARRTSALDLDRLLVPAGDGAIIAAPYLRVSDLPSVGDGASLHERMRQLYAQLWEASHLRQPDFPSIVTGHLQVRGGEISDSERPTLVGGEDAAPTDVFPAEATYVALGHLHRAQSMDAGRVRYSGSPIPLSATERTYKHQIVLVDTRAGGELTTTDIPIPRAVPHLRVPSVGGARPSEALDHLQSVVSALRLPADTPPERRPMIELHLQLDAPSPKAAPQIIEDVARSGLPVRIIKVVTATAGAPVAEPPGSAKGLAAQTPETLFVEAFRQTHGCAPADAHLAVMRQVLHTVAP